jgi:serine/threonine protein kinase
LECLDLLHLMTDILENSSIIKKHEDSCLDFIDKCLQVDMVNRWTIDQLWKHDWMKQQQQLTSSSSFIMNETNLSEYSICNELTWIDWYAVYCLYHGLTLKDLLFMKDMEAKMDRSNIIDEITLDLTPIQTWLNHHTLEILEEILNDDEKKKEALLSKYEFRAEAIRQPFQKSATSIHSTTPSWTLLDYIQILCKLHRSRFPNDHLQTWLDGRILPDTLRSRAWQKLLDLSELSLPVMFPVSSLSISHLDSHQYDMMFCSETGRFRLSKLLRAFLSHYKQASYWQGRQSNKQLSVCSCS